MRSISELGVNAMTLFETDGFLSDEISGWQGDFEKRYSTKLQLSTEVNRVAHQLIFSMEITSSELKDLLLSTLLARQVSTFQAFILLARKGLIDQAEMLVRALAESMFLVGAIRKDAGFAEKWVLSDEISRKRSLVRLNDDRRRRGEPPDEAAAALIVELTKRIRDEDIEKISTERIAQLAGLESYYDTVYGFFSMAVHSSTRSLDKALQTDGDGNVTSIAYGPVIDGFDMHFDFAITMTLYVLHEVAVHFKKDPSPVKALQKKNHDLARPATEPSI